MKISTRVSTLAIGLISLVLWSACQAPPVECACAKRSLRVSSTTSVDNTGLWAELQKAFTKKTGIRIQILAVGTGKAIKLAANGDVDALLVHDRKAELAFLAQGHGLNHTEVMKNDFVIVGPKANPAGIAGKDVAAALSSIAEKQSPFVSRGDDSGTHKAEKRLWQAAGIEASGQWHIEAGQGMRMTLTVADQETGLLHDRPGHLPGSGRQGRASDSGRRRRTPAQPLCLHSGRSKQTPRCPLHRGHGLGWLFEFTRGPGDHRRVQGQGSDPVHPGASHEQMNPERK